MQTIRVILVDDHSIVREGLRMIIENDPEIEVVGETGDIHDAIALVKSREPDLLLLDLDLGDKNALEYMTEFSTAGSRLRILILTGVLDQDVHQKAIQLGAGGILLKNQVGSTLLKAIKKIHQGEAWIDRVLTAKILAAGAGHSSSKDNPERQKIASLTNREREIVKLIAEGLANKEISERLYVGEKTVRNNLSTIYSKLEVANRLELAIYAARHGLDR